MWTEKGGDICKPVSFDAFLNITLENTGTRISQGVVVFQQLVNVTGIFTFNESDKWLLWKKRNEACFHRPARKAEENFFHGDRPHPSTVIRASYITTCAPIAREGCRCNSCDRRKGRQDSCQARQPLSPPCTLQSVWQVRAACVASTPAQSNASDSLPVEVGDLDRTEGVWSRDPAGEGFS